MRTSRKARILWFIERAAFFACALLMMPITAAAFGDGCFTRIEVVFATHVANPRNPGFTALTANPAYTLAWVEGRGSRHVYDLSGPGTDTQCRDGVELLQRDPAVMQLRVIETQKF